jgi:hypothetical protein
VRSGAAALAGAAFFGLAPLAAAAHAFLRGLAPGGRAPA